MVKSPNLLISNMKSCKFGINHIIAIQFLIIAFLLPSPVTSQPPSDNPNTYNGSLSPRVGLTVLVITIAIFFMAFIWLFIRSCFIDESSPSVTVIPLTAVHRGARGGLDVAVIESFPTFDYSAVKALKIGKGALECAVCLNEFEGDETLRLIPRCDHVFHAECIDVWLASHATCPVCRAYLVPDPGEPLDAPIRNDDVSIDVARQPATIEEQVNISRPPPWLNRSRTRGSASGRPRWFGLMSARSNSTGHVADVRLEDTDRFTLRVTEEVRRQIMCGKLSRTSSSIAMQMAESSSLRGDRTGFSGL